MRGLHFVAVESTTAAEAHAQTRALMRSGADLMYQGEIHYESTDIKKAGLEWKKEKIASDCVWKQYLLKRLQATFRWLVYEFQPLKRSSKVGVL